MGVDLIFPKASFFLVLSCILQEASCCINIGIMTHY